ncbi:DNA polymerase III subunit gamma and tau [Salinibacterium sp. NSLL150]|uniref:DNA polymerase III subunit gamma and tau n=1 Tax=unclassified Salinibacterium TaxID=2632331 RepID=UPI0018CFD8BA|nr:MULTISPECIES: DNA polymerase III subunit gamma and tau [unclassified Salinibacterium]MBH0099814.1 DNA polymerase III subunit gamma and tau [Salinibacterium sp. NSLL35]MBH0102568.1 DNA polymerase III subunit gamma and tau [Salinibacterium sp. NSLL150]MBH0105328.1 DNA polymerase III subunit gamma and tau [Salinibacterium sp. NSLL16]MBH0108088.1 DNA polymerase III subunit gamma and tau [Salinibacterium sp. NSLL17]MBH0110859.1 DNA polymerase III subunit gamma and tau [Salinibacterium sp. NG22]
MVAALYRRYRPETFAELIGQSQVTDPLRTALRTDRVNHAYLFSGPRGCGKTTSARILARCLNCAEGPTDTPCGVCASCVELSRDGGGSLDVVEIDAASHNGVEDARDLRERAVFAPARDRFKIFILDEAHMVTPQGFNAMLKIVEEPPEHVKFIFATTEPDKVIGTIRSRTHHYPFRLVPPAQMLDYVQQLCESENVEVEPGVLPLVVRAGGGSVRDTLSLLDQLIAGSDTATVGYERAVALLGYTHAELLDEVIDALGTGDAAAAFSSVDRVIQTGQDPRRFVEDLLERMRDLIVVAATADNAASVLRGIPQDQLERMAQQAHTLGAAELSRAADVINAALSEMTGATSPRLHLELMIARILVPASDNTQRGALARVERLERRIGIEGDAPIAAAPAASAAPSRAAAPASAAAPAERPGAEAPRASAPETPAATSVAPAAAPAAASSPPAPAASNTGLSAPAAPRTTPVSIQQVRDAWPEILDVVENLKRTAWMVVFTAKPLELRDDKILVLSFPSQRDVDALKQRSAPGEGVGDYLKKAVVHVLGFEPAFIAKVEGAPSAPPAGRPAAAAPQQESRMPAPEMSPEPTAQPRSPQRTVPAVDEGPEPEEPAPAEDREPGGWAVAAIPESEPEPEGDPSAARGGAAAQRTANAQAQQAQQAAKKPTADRLAEAAAAAPPAPPESMAKAAMSATAAQMDRSRYGESVVRELLNATFIEEEQVAPRVVPQPRDE